MGSPHRREDGRQPAVLTLRLTTEPGRQPIGEPARIAVQLGNATTEDLWVVGVLDGSEEGARYPHYRPAVLHDEVVVAAAPPPEDPLVGPLRAADFHRLAPGETFDPIGSGTAGQLFTFTSFRPAEPGVYRFTLTLSTESQQPEDWLGRFGQDAERAAVLELLPRVPRLTVTSDPLDVTFV